MKCPKCRKEMNWRIAEKAGGGYMKVYYCKRCGYATPRKITHEDGEQFND